jgi:hypothetical protein
MRKLFLTVTTLLTLTLATQAQKKSGAIQFETTIDAVATAVANGVQLSDEMKARMPKAVKTNFELLYTPTNASYMMVEEFEDSNGGGGGGNNMGRMMMRFGGAGGAREYFYTFADQKLVEVFELSDTTYAMQSKLTVASNMPANFNMGGQRPNNPNAAPASTSAVQFLPGPPTMEVEKSDETKSILGFTCNKVIVKSIRKAKVLDMDRDIVDETVLWYTKDLGFNFSPNPNLWTEGTVLAIENKGTSTIAKGIEYRNVSTKDVTAPKKAVSITADEYKVKMENMMRRFSGGGNRQGAAPARMIIN